MSQGVIPPAAATQARNPPRARMDEPSIARPTVFGLFASSAALNNAIKELEMAGFDRADLSLPDTQPRNAPDLSPKPPDTGVEAQQSRIFHTSVAGAFAAVVAAMIAAALGGGVGPMVGAAIAAALVVSATVHLISRAASRREQMDRDRKAASGRLVLSVRTPAAVKVAHATEILQRAGAVKIW
jgi:hypothetical protein